MQQWPALQRWAGRVDAAASVLRITPIDRASLTAPVTCACGESGSTARFLLPVAAVLGQHAPVTLGRSRPFARTPLCPSL